jgi:hypothetical protein
MCSTASAPLVPPVSDDELARYLQVADQLRPAA